jgi:hypothetical protein
MWWTKRWGNQKLDGLKEKKDVWKERINERVEKTKESVQKLGKRNELVVQDYREGRGEDDSTENGSISRRKRLRQEYKEAMERKREAAAGTSGVVSESPTRKPGAEGPQIQGLTGAIRSVWRMNRGEKK